MDEQIPLIERPSMYETLKAKGVDMSWYERIKAKKGKPLISGHIPLAKEKCYRLSIYLLKTDGSLWTIQSDGKPYAKVREMDKKPREDTFICVHCGQLYETVSEAYKHFKD